MEYTKSDYTKAMDMLMEFKPKNAKMGYLWWHEDDIESRLKVIEKLIKMTKPKTTKRKKKTTKKLKNNTIDLLPFKSMF